MKHGVAAEDLKQDFPSVAPSARKRDECRPPHAQAVIAA
jgi:hypothetical protein